MRRLNDKSKEDHIFQSTDDPVEVADVITQKTPCVCDISPAQNQAWGDLSYTLILKDIFKGCLRKMTVHSNILTNQNQCKTAMTNNTSNFKQGQRL